MAWVNADGLKVRFGQDWAKKAVNQARAVRVAGNKFQLEIDVDLTQIPTTTVSYTTDRDNDGTVDGFTTGDTYLPANASVSSVELLTVEAAVGGTSFVIGTYGLTGSAISANSLVTATEGVIANFDTIGKRTFGAGALVSASAGTAGVGTADAYIGVKPTGTFTAGKLKVIIHYSEPLPDA